MLPYLSKIRRKPRITPNRKSLTLLRMRGRDDHSARSLADNKRSDFDCFLRIRKRYFTMLQKARQKTLTIWLSRVKENIEVIGSSLKKNMQSRGRMVKHV